jgi:eukaryotic-like serine/threonine-protein kinase
MKLGPYEIQSPLGAGGLGEREAKAISSLNHSNICTLHDIGEQDGTLYLVMEYLIRPIGRGLSTAT